MVLALLLFGMPLGAADAPVAAGQQSSDDAAGPIWFSSGRSAPAAPESRSSREAPEAGMAAPSVGTLHALGSRSGQVVACRDAASGASTPLYLRHCAFLC